MRKWRWLFLLFFAVSTGWIFPVIASAAPEAGSSRHCLSLAQIKRVEILDKQHIAFEMIDGGYYLNVLPYSCSSLHGNRALMYTTSLSSLCDLDIITLLDTVGGGYEPAGSCGLGDFNESSEDEIKRLRDIE